MGSLVLENLFLEGSAGLKNPAGNDDYLHFIVGKFFKFLLSREYKKMSNEMNILSDEWIFDIIEDGTPGDKYTLLRLLSIDGSNQHKSFAKFDARTESWPILISPSYSIWKPGAFIKMFARHSLVSAWGSHHNSLEEAKAMLVILNDIPCDPNQEFARWILESAPAEYEKRLTKKRQAQEGRLKSKADRFSIREQGGIIHDCKALYAQKISAFVREQFDNLHTFTITPVDLWFKEESPGLKYLNDVLTTPNSLEEDGKRLYEGIVECLGKEEAESFFSTSYNKNVRRLGVVHGGHEVAGLVDKSDSVRLAAKKVYEKKVQES